LCNISLGDARQARHTVWRGPAEAGDEEMRMSYDPGADFRRPIPLFFAAVAVVGWLLVLYYASQVSQAQNEMADELGRAEKARSSLAADFQNLQKASGSLADVNKQVADAKAALGAAVAARENAQRDLGAINKDIADARLKAKGATDEAVVRTNDLQALQARIKAAGQQLAAVQPQIDAATAERNKAIAASDDAKGALADLKKQRDAAVAAVNDAKSELAEVMKQSDAASAAVNDAKNQLSDLQKQSEAATKTLADIQAKAAAAQQALDAATKAKDEAAKPDAQKP
jgi:chromosome segregation ATPase